MENNSKLIDKYSNYMGYILGDSSKKQSHEVSEERLVKAITRCKELLKRPYIRFMWRSDTTLQATGHGDCDDAFCVVYDGNERKTRLIPLHEVEAMLEAGVFKKD